MESPELNSQSNDEDRRLETWLRETPGELPDAGFSTRVLAALPRKKTPFHLSSRFMLCLIGGVLGVAMAVRHVTVAANEVDTVVARLNESLTALSPLVTNPRFLAALVVTGASLALAFRLTDRRRLFGK